MAAKGSLWANWEDWSIRLLNYLVIGLSAIILLGWAFQIRGLVSLGTGLISIKANTAICFVLLGIASWLQSRKQAPVLVRLLAGFIIVLSAIVISQDILGRNFGVDELFFSDFDYTPENSTGPGRMSPFTAISFILLGFSLLASAGPWIALRQPAILAVQVISVLTLISYPFKASGISGLFVLTTMAIQTAILFYLASLNLFLQQSDSPVKQLLVAEDSLGSYTRRLMAAALFAPLLLAWLVSLGESRGLYDSASSKSLVVMGVVLVLAGIIVQSAKRLRESEEQRSMIELDFDNTQLQLQAIVENSPSAMFTRDRNGRYLLVNRLFAETVGLEPERILGQEDAQLFPADFAKVQQEEHQQVLETGEALVSEKSFKEGDQKVVFLGTIYPLYNREGEIQAVGGFWVDITERKKVVEDLRRSNAELEQFAYVASHDLQEPLRMVSSYMQLLETRHRDQLSDDAKEFIDFAVDGANRMQALIQDLLAFSRVGTRAAEMVPVESHQAVNTAITHLTRLMEENGAVVEVGELPMVIADESQLVQIFQNLLSNAIKFRGEEAPHIWIKAEPRDGQIEFSVRDNGIGFDPKHAERIFVIFQRLNQRGLYSGTGIGLAICKKIIERHGGRIWADSQPNKGSRFSFTLPSAGEMAALPPKELEGAEALEERASRLL